MSFTLMNLDIEVMFVLPIYARK